MTTAIRASEEPDVARAALVADVGQEPTTADAASEGAAEPTIDRTDRPPTTSRPTDGDGRRWLTMFGVAAFVAFVVVKLGPSLVGARVFAATEVIARWSPWADGSPLPRLAVPLIGDTIDWGLPGYVEMHSRLFSGDVPLWSTLASPGTTLMLFPSLPTLNPASVWMLVFPTWWAAGFVKLVQLVLAFSFMTLWLRRLGAVVPAGMLAGLAYCGSGFFVSWGQWPAQSVVASLIPGLFWAIERYVQLRTVRAAIPVAVAVAFLLLGGFPATAGHALYAGGIYFIVRVLADRRAFTGTNSWWTFAGGTAAVLLGVALAAIQFLPLISQLADTDLDYRSNQFNAQLSFRSLLSLFNARIFNTAGYGRITAIETYAFVGLGVLALAGLAVCAPRAAGVKRGVITFLAAGAVFAGLLVWKHGFWTDWLSQFPVFENNSSRRIRDMVGFFLCALGGVGANLIFKPRLPQPVRRRLTIIGVAGLAAAGIVTWVIVRRYGPETDTGQLWQDATLGLVTAATVVALLMWGRNRTVRDGLGTLLIALIAVQTAISVSYFWPTGPRDAFYPDNPTITAAREASNHDRVLPLGAFPGSSGQANDVRTINSHSFQAPSWKDLLRAVQPKVYLSPTYSAFSFQLTDEEIHNPILDRLAATTVLTRSGVRVPGTLKDATGKPMSGNIKPDGTPLTLNDGQPITVDIPATALRGVDVYLPATFGDNSDDLTITATVHRPNDPTPLAQGAITRGTYRPGWLTIAVPGENLDTNAGPLKLTIALTTTRPPQNIHLGTFDGNLALRLTAPAADGLRELFADVHGSVWQRTTALPRIRWAAHADVITDPAARVTRLADPTLPDDTVVLNTPGPLGDGKPAQVTITADNGDNITAQVNATGGGYLVLADGVQDTWQVTVDGNPATLIDADHALVGVWIPTGNHTVSFGVSTTRLKTGAALTTVALLTIAGALAATSPRLRRRLRRRSEVNPPMSVRIGRTASGE